MTPSRSRTILYATGAAVCSMLVGLAAARSGRSNAYQWFDPLVDVHSIVTREYVEEPDKDALITSAISGMLESLNDPYTEFIPAKDTAEFDKQTRGEFVGIGAEVRAQDGWLLIVSPIEDSPAYRAGVMAGDRVTAVNGVSTYEKSVGECIEMLTGKPGTPVTITVDRDGKTLDITIVRERILTPTVRGVHRVDDKWTYWIDPARKIAYIRLSQFAQGSASDFFDAVSSLMKDGLATGGLVLDLRFNPGGLFPASIEIADLFLREGVIVSTKGRAHPEQKFTARAEGTLPDFPVVVLVNRQSASASEIVAGALADNNRAIVVGERSFGKGLVQTVVPLPSGAGQLKITEQHYYLPSGRNIQRKDDSTVWGVDPTPGFYVPMTDDEYRAMLEIRRQEEIIRRKDAAAPTGPDAPQWNNPDWILTHLKDKQLAAAVDAIRLRLDSGDWTPTGETRPPESIAQAELNRLQQSRERITRELARVDRRIDTLSRGVAVPKNAELIPDSARLAGGKVDIFDADGKRVATLSITGPDLGRWLIDAPVKPADADRTPAPAGR